MFDPDSIHDLQYSTEKQIILHICCWNIWSNILQINHLIWLQILENGEPLSGHFAGFCHNAVLRLRLLIFMRQK